MKPASYGRRIGAAFLDLVIVSVVSYVIFIPIVKYLHVEERTAAFQDKVAAAQQAGDMVSVEDLQPMLTLALTVCALVVILVFLMHVYYVYFESSPKGQTPGKKAFGLRVVTLEGAPITRMQALYREMIRWYVDGLFLFPAFIAMARTPMRQRVGDILAKTMVIDINS